MSSWFFFKFYLFIFGCVGSSFCARAPSSCGERGPPFTAARWPPTVAASPVAEHRPQTHRLSRCGSRAQPLRGMWDPPGPGLEPVCPALAGRLPTTAPPGKPLSSWFLTMVPRPLNGETLVFSINGDERTAKEWSWTPYTKINL